MKHISSLQYIFSLLLLFLTRYKIIASKHKHIIYDESININKYLSGSYYMYDPTLFDMTMKCTYSVFTDCSHSEPKPPSPHIDKHTVDYLFIKTLIQLNASVVNPNDADLFVVPVLYSLSMDKLCGDHLHNIQQMFQVLHQLGHYKEGTRNHLIIAVSHIFITQYL